MSIPKKARRLNFNSEDWYWMNSGASYMVIIWAPNGQKYRVPNWKILGRQASQWNYDDVPYSERYALPGDVRKYIEEHILASAPEFTKDENALLGKLYVYRESDHGQAPVARIHEIEPAGLRTAEKFFDHLSEKKPVFLLQHWINKEEKVGFYKLLVESYIVTIKIGWPRTWLGSFVLADPEKTP